MNRYVNQSDQVPTFVPVADHALLVDFSFGDSVVRDAEAEKVANVAVIALDHAITASAIDGVLEVVPALVNLLVEFDPVTTDHSAVEASLRDVLAGTAGARSSPTTTHRVPACYDPSVAPDLETVATACNLSVDAVIAAHLAGDYRVLMYGFAPGYAYLSGVAGAIQVPRKPAPVRDVPAGSVIIAGSQCLITTITMPTGWSIVGASPTRVLPVDPNEPFLFELGDRIEFERIDLATLSSLRETL